MGCNFTLPELENWTIRPGMALVKYPLMFGKTEIKREESLCSSCCGIFPITQQGRQQGES